MADNVCAPAAPKLTVPVPGTNTLPVPLQAVVLTIFAFNVLDPPFNVPAVKITVPIVVCNSPAPRFIVPPVPFIVIPVEFTLPVNVTTPPVLVHDNLPVVINPPMVWLAAVPVIVIAEEPKLTFALVLLLTKLPVPNVIVPAPVLVIVPVAELVSVPVVCDMVPAGIVIEPLLVREPVVLTNLPAPVKLITPLLVCVPVLPVNPPVEPEIVPLFTQLPVTVSIRAATARVPPASMVIWATVRLAPILTVCVF